MSVTLIPRMSEKAYAQTQASNTYIFVVPMTSNGKMVKEEIEKQFKVKVKDVRTVVSKGKAKKSFTKRTRMVGKRADFKKAYVSLSEGKINIFGEEDKKAGKSKTAKPDSTVAVKAEAKPKGKIRSALGRSSRTVQNKGGDK
ncbi:MAG: 50S ribosomal protein L23 [bacterium]|nr:50S ribosomal protein L23 [bacterium]